MSYVRLQHRLAAPPELVWDVLTDHEVLSRRISMLERVEVVEGHGVGMRRCLYDTRGRYWFERCVAWEDGHSYTMETEMEEFPYPYNSMRGTLGVKDLGDDTVQVFIRFEYTPSFGLLGHLFDRLYMKWRLAHYLRRLMRSLRDEIGAREAKYNILVETILKKKGYGVAYVDPSKTLEEVAQELTRRKIGSVLVSDDGETLLGIVSERDIVIGIANHGEKVLEWPIEKIMTRNVHVTSPQTDLDTLMSIMTDRRIRHLPVMEDNKVIGMISIGDVVKARMTKMAYDSESLRIYIAAKKWREEHKHMPVSGL